ncbi:dual specificity protein kinase Ttk [Lampris incognitus]|uniref:dual specificity protein kinase Ttk n=1 Tax=Lampris incognitus TaxID=2546036 RepID=UPI0024B54CB1|nr:dual specificity protein kinase Ttk [Lampris incognitus]
MTYPHVCSEVWVTLPDHDYDVRPLSVEDQLDAEKKCIAFLEDENKKLKNDTDNINKVIGSNSAETCYAYLFDMEKRADPRSDSKHLARLMDGYTRVLSNMPLGKHGQNESYARMLVRFAELKAIQDVNEAEANFNVAKSHSQNFSFVHIAHAQFEHSQGNTKKGIHILQRAMELDAKPKELLETALQSLQSGKAWHHYTEDKENVSEFRKDCRKSDGTGDLELPSVFSSGTEPLNGLSHQKRAGVLPGRIPVVPFSIPELNDDSDGWSSKPSDAFIPKSLSRQTSGSNTSAVFTHSSSKKTAVDGDFFNCKPPTVSPEPCPWEDQTTVDSTTTLFNRQDKKNTFRMEDSTFNFEQIINSDSPASCWTYLLDMEKSSNPHTDSNLLTKLKDYYSKVFFRLPIGKFSKNESYARILVRYAELKGIEDPDEAQDHFIVARSNCKGFAFVHIAHAQFEVSQGNFSKATSILHKAHVLNAQPSELLEVAMRNLKAREKQLIPTKREKSTPDLHADAPLATCGGNQELQIPTRASVDQSTEQTKPKKEPLAEWKMLPAVSHQISPQEKYMTPPDPRSVPRLLDCIPTPSLPLPSRPNPSVVCQTPQNFKTPQVDSYVTPVLKRDPEVAASAVHRAAQAQKPCTHPKQMSYPPTPQDSLTSLSHESITINGKQFLILKMIGRGGSSKVYQVLDHKKQLFAVKYVNLEEADAQTIESYKNEIEHLNHLQQYSDQIIKLFDYQITNSYIYMLMECGNLDLNTWLRNRKAVNPLERKFYWKNMLEAVHTIHKHGIVHSDLKPANFVIVNASLKLIDFGIANRIQPDVTSIMKDSQVGTLNYMPPEAIKDTSSKPGKASSKISPKGDVWSLGCILYCMTYGKTPFQSIANQITKLHAIVDPSHKIEFPNIAEGDLLDVLKRCLVRNPKERISIAELLEHPYLQLLPQTPSEPEYPNNSDLKRILTDLAALQSPNSIIRAANNLARMCNSGRKLDVAECAKLSSKHSWKM